MTTALQVPLGAAQQDCRQIVVQVRICVTQTGAIENHCVVEKRSVAIRRGGQPVEEIGDVLGVIHLNLDDLVDLVLFVLVMGQGMVPVGDTDLAVSASTKFAAQHKRADAREIGLIG